MLLLALDTATPAVAVALHDGTRVVAESTTPHEQRHGELLAPALSSLLAQAGRTPSDLTGVVVGVGPGPYTGLRVGVTTGRVLAAALGVPVEGVCSLDAIAWASHRDRAFAVVTDARRREVYWAAYSDHRTRTAGPHVGRPDEVVPLLGGVPLIGPATELYDLPGAVEAEPFRAGALAELAAVRLAGGDPLLPPVPLYLRRPDASPPSGRKRVLR